jgi:3-deoxy-D-manno-octulosonate 8-phosphate phosphatase (KDO 8-P phosphatase)
MNQTSNEYSNAVTPERWAKIKLLALDVDGVLTDGSLCFDESGSLLQTFHVRDGFALVAARREGLIIAWISGRASAVAEKRFAELQLHHCILACRDKAAAMRDLQAQHNLSPEECCFVGDDLPDLPAFSRCDIRVAVNDAVPEVRSRANYLTQERGGRGAVREVVELILDAQGKWQPLVEQFARTDTPQPENLQR